MRPQRQASEHHRPGGPARLSLPYRGAGGGPERGRDLRRVTQRVGAPTPLPANPRPFLFLLGMKEGAGSPSLGPTLGKSSVNPTEGWSPSLEGLPGSVQWIELPPPSPRPSQGVEPGLGSRGGLGAAGRVLTRTRLPPKWIPAQPSPGLATPLPPWLASGLSRCDASSSEPSGSLRHSSVTLQGEGGVSRPARTGTHCFLSCWDLS